MFKTLFVVVILIFLTGNKYVTAQEVHTDARNFIRIYNHEGKKIGKGHIRVIGDSALVVLRRKELVTFRVEEIGSIRTKRSAGHNFLVINAATTGLMIIGFVGASDGSDGWFSWDAPTGVAIGFVAGAFFGIPASALSLLLKKVTRYEINGNYAQWELFRQEILQQGR